MIRYTMSQLFDIKKQNHLLSVFITIKYVKYTFNNIIILLVSAKCPSGKNHEL